MTYGVAMPLDTGLVFLADSRTNAGVDMIGTFRKPALFECPVEHVLVMQTSDDLFLSQSVTSVLRERIEASGDTLHPLSAPNLIEAARCVGAAPRLFSVYAIGNFIETTPDKTRFRIGESKYGKPIIDRVIRCCSSIIEAVKCALVSMHSTIHSNLSVGPPLDLVVGRRNHFMVARHVSIDADNAYFPRIRGLWSDALRHASTVLPEPDWLGLTR